MLPHPLGARDKGRLLANLLEWHDLETLQNDRGLCALFPELYFYGRAAPYDQSVLATFRRSSLLSGDRSEDILAHGQEIFTRMPPGDIGMSAWEPVIEMSPDFRGAARFLLFHYYAHGMFRWFWRVSGMAPAGDQAAHAAMAFDVAVFDGYGWDAIDPYFRDLLRVSGADRPRIWMERSIHHLLRGESWRAAQSLAHAEKLLSGSRSAGDRVALRQEGISRIRAILKEPPMGRHEKAEALSILDHLGREMDLAGLFCEGPAGLSRGRAKRPAHVLEMRYLTGATTLREDPEFRESP